MAEGAPLFVASTPANGAASGYFPTAAGNPPFPQAYYPMAAASPGGLPLMLPAGASMHGVGYMPVPVPVAPGGVFFVPSAHHQSQPQTPLPAPPLFFSYQQQHSLGFLPPSAAAAAALPHALTLSAFSGSRTNLAATTSSPLGAHDAQTSSDAPKMTRGKRTAAELYGTPVWWGDSEELAASAPVPPAPSDARAAPRAARELAAAAAAAAADEAEEASSSMSPNAERAGSGARRKQSPSEPASRAAGGASFLVELVEPELHLQRLEEASGSGSGGVARAEANSGISFEIDLDVGEEQPRRVRESLSQFVPSHVRKSMREREELVRSRAGRSRDAALVDSLNVADAPPPAASRPPASPRVTPRACLAPAPAAKERVSGSPKQLGGSRAPPNVCKSMELLEVHSTHSESSAHTAGDGVGDGVGTGTGEQTSSSDKKRARPALTSSTRALPVTPRSARTPRAVGASNANLSSSSSRIAIKPPLMTQHAAALSPRKHSRPELHTEPTRASKPNAPAVSSASRPATASARKASEKAAPVKPVKLTSSQTFNRSGAQQTSSRQSAKSLSTRRPSGSATAATESVMAAIASFPDTKSYLLDKMLAETAKRPLPAAVRATRATSRPSSASAKQQPQPQALAQSQRPASRQQAGSASVAVGPKPPEFELYPEAQRFAALPAEASGGGESLALHVDEADLDEAEARSETGTYTVQQDSPDEPLDSPENEEATQARLDAAIERALSNPGDEPLEQPAAHETPAAAAPPTAGPLSSSSFPTFTRRKTGATPDALLPRIGEASGNEDAERTLTAPICAFALRGTALCSLPHIALTRVTARFHC